MPIDHPFPRLLLLVFFALLAVTCHKDHSAQDRRFSLANEKYSQGNLDEAIQTYNQILTEDDEHTSARVMLGKAYYFKRDFVKAREQLEKAAKKEPDRTDVLLWLAKTQSLTSDSEDKALANLARILDQDPGHLEANYLKGRILERKQNLPEAMKAYNLVIREARKAALAAARVGTILRKAGLREQAEKAFKQARELATGDRSLLQQLEKIESAPAANDPAM